MTLIIARVSRRYVLQTTDRLVTSQAPRPRPWEGTFNKNLLYSAKNGVVAMGFTGIAYVEGVPTDQWLAQQLVDKPLNGPPGEPTPAYISGRVRPWRDVGSVLNTLRDSLSAVSARLTNRNRREQWRLNPFVLLCVGWLWNRNRPSTSRPFIAYILKEEQRTDFDLLWSSPRAGATQEGMVVAAPRSPFVDSALASLAPQLGDANPDDAERLMVEATRKCAHEAPVIGHDVLSVLLPPPKYACIRIRFIPRSLVQKSRIIPNSQELSFSPWVIGPCGIVGPAAFYGRGLSMGVGGHFRLDFECPERRPGAPIFAFGSQVRRPPPNS
jgi:hypothetical protein